MHVCLHGVKHTENEGRAAIIWAAKEFGSLTLDEAVAKYSIPSCWILAHKAFLVQERLKGKV